MLIKEYSSIKECFTMAKYLLFSYFITLLTIIERCKFNPFVNIFVFISNLKIPL